MKRWSAVVRVRGARYWTQPVAVTVQAVAPEMAMKRAVCEVRRKLARGTRIVEIHATLVVLETVKPVVEEVTT